jgi:hypothetical protein
MISEVKQIACGSRGNRTPLKGGRMATDGSHRKREKGAQLSVLQSIGRTARAPAGAWITPLWRARERATWRWRAVT